MSFLGGYRRGLGAVTPFYHGGGREYRDDMTAGGGVDGPGYYFTTSCRRALQYGKRDTEGRDREPFITTVAIDLDKHKIWHDDEKVNANDFIVREGFGRLEPRVYEWLIRDHKNNDEGRSLDVDRAFIRQLWLDKNNEMLKEMGYQAIKTNRDLIVLDPSIIKYGEP